MAYYKKALYSRIYDKIKFDPVEKFAFVITLCIATLFSFFSCVNCYAAEVEDVDFNINESIRLDTNSNVFISSSGSTIKLGYFLADPGYVYYIKNLNAGTSLPIATSNDLPSLNENYSYLGLLSAQDTYTFRGNGNVYFNINVNSTGSNVQVTREKLANYDGVVSDLVDNVGTNQIWSVFENGISFVGVVVLVAFGLFLVVLAIKKVSKGKSEF